MSGAGGREAGGSGGAGSDSGGPFRPGAGGPEPTGTAREPSESTGPAAVDARPAGPAFGMFAKPPRPGEVKTRLVPPLLADDAARLYAAMLADTAVTLAAAGVTWGVVSTDVAAQRAAWPKDAPEPQFWLTQTGADLGERMANAMGELLGMGGFVGEAPVASAAAPGAVRPVGGMGTGAPVGAVGAGGLVGAVLVGSDHPGVGAATYRRAADLLAGRALERDTAAGEPGTAGGPTEVILGPTADGGYYLIGMRAPHPELFTGMAWSTPRVFADTLKRARNADLHATILDPGWDVDRPEDLSRLRSWLAGSATPGGPDEAPGRFTRKVMRSLPPV